MADTPFPTLAAYLEDRLPHLTFALRDRLVASHPWASPARCMEVAAAHLNAHLQAEYADLLDASRALRHTYPAPLVTWLQDLELRLENKRERSTWAEQLCDVSGSRTLLNDTHAVKMKQDALSYPPLPHPRDL